MTPFLSLRVEEEARMEERREERKSGDGVFRHLRKERMMRFRKSRERKDEMRQG